MYAPCSEDLLRDSEGREIADNWMLLSRPLSDPHPHPRKFTKFGFLSVFTEENVAKKETGTRTLQKPFRDSFGDPFRNPSKTFIASGDSVAGNESLDVWL